MPQLSWSREATDDLWAIDAWLEENASSEVALATLATITFRAATLKDFPRIGRPLAEGVRVLRVIDTPHLIFYRLNADAIEILRIRHEREDWRIEP